MKEQNFATGYYFEIKWKLFENELSKVEGFIVGGNSVSEVVKKSVKMLDIHFRNCKEAPLIIVGNEKLLSIIKMINDFPAEDLKKDMNEKGFDVWAIQLLVRGNYSYPDEVLKKIFG